MMDDFLFRNLTTYYLDLSASLQADDNERKIRIIQGNKEFLGHKDTSKVHIDALQFSSRANLTIPTCTE